MRFRNRDTEGNGIKVLALRLGILQVVCSLLLVFPFLLKAEDGIILYPANGSSVENHSFGSQQILSNCWTPRELRGKPEEKAIRIAPLSSHQDPPQGRFPNHSFTPLKPELQNSIRRVQPMGDKKVVALTFDLCETGNEIAGYDAAIVDYLRDNKVKATFFAGGKWMHSHPDRTMQLIADPLFEVGNHSWTHANFRLIDAGKMEEQILWTQAQYEILREELQSRVLAKGLDPIEMNKIPKTPLVFRFPYGTCNSQSLNLLKSYGLAAIQWDVVTGDPAKGRTAPAIVRAILQQAKPGSIIICHANGRGHGTAESLPLFIPKLRALGYEFVTVSELLTYGPAVAGSDCYELRPRDNLRYDKLSRPK